MLIVFLKHLNNEQIIFKSVDILVDFEWSLMEWGFCILAMLAGQFTDLESETHKSHYQPRLRIPSQGPFHCHHWWQLLPPGFSAQELPNEAEAELN
jgi:hypothetical protein